MHHTTSQLLNSWRVFKIKTKWKWIQIFFQLGGRNQWKCHDFGVLALSNLYKDVDKNLYEIQKRRNWAWTELHQVSDLTFISLSFPHNLTRVVATLRSNICKILGIQQVQLAYMIITVQTNSSEFSDFQCAQNEKKKQAVFLRREHSSHVLLGDGLKFLVGRWNQENIRKRSTD